ncbi:peptidase MA family metallohydrolase [Paenibacillus sp. NPDC058174]|uniref:peptidase MA family metallohydrolase n=1 Tax=Paenibacillus sp. NPDC058174 TaxID=3346366 RepID=UPI0036DAB923
MNRRCWSFTLFAVLLLLLTACGNSNDRKVHLIQETEHGLFYSPDSQETAGQAISVLAEAFEENYERISEMFQFQTSGKTVNYVYTDKPEFQSVMGRETEGTYDASDKIIKVFTPSNLAEPIVQAYYTDQIVHEFVHAVIQQINPDIGQVKWLDEGLAYYASKQLEQELQQKRTFGSLPSLEQFAAPDYFDRAGGDAYFYSGMMVQYIIEVYGIETMNEVIRNPQQEQMERILGLSIPELYERWRTDLLNEK